MVEISYDELIKEYNSSLANVLRGFRPKYDFLEQWVPDANLMKSIVNLVESAHSYGMPQLSLRVDQQVLKGIEFNELKNEISEFCQLEVINQGDAALLKFNRLIPLNGMLVKTHIIEENEIPEIYKCQLSEVLKDIQHESTVVDDDRHLLIRGNINGCSLFLSIEPTKHIIAKTAFSGANSDIDRAVMEAFCRLIQGMSIQEASDHGVIRLEYKLRDHDTRRPVPGIVNPFNIHRIFQLPMKLIRSIRQKYAEDHQFTEARNFWDDPVSANWQQATLDERLHRVQHAIDGFRSQKSLDHLIILATDIQKNVKISISIEGGIKSQEKAELMMSLEKVIRQNVEPKIELYQEMWKDKNKGRRL